MAQQRPGGGGAAAPALDLSHLDPAQPQNFYLPEPSLQALSDCHAEVEGVAFPLHSQLLGMQSSVLRELFIARCHSEGGLAGEASPNLSAAFHGSSAADTACFLRLVYCPHEVQPASFTALAAAGRLQGMARLADKLHTSHIMDGGQGYVQGLISTQGHISLPELLTALHISQVWQLPAEMQSSCLDRIADKLLDTGGYQQGSPAELMTALGSATLTQLVDRIAWRASQAPTLQDVEGSNPGSTQGGFTVVVRGLSRHGQQGTQSPWADVGGFKWRAEVFYMDAAGAGGENIALSVRLALDAVHAKARGVRHVTARPGFGIIDQVDSSRNWSRNSPAAVTFTASDCPVYRIMLLTKLRSADYGFLHEDRLLLRITLHDISPAP